MLAVPCASLFAAMPFGSGFQSGRTVYRKAFFVELAVAFPV